VIPQASRPALVKLAERSSELLFVAQEVLGSSPIAICFPLPRNRRLKLRGLGQLEILAWQLSTEAGQNGYATRRIRLQFIGIELVT